MEAIAIILFGIGLITSFWLREFYKLQTKQVVLLEKLLKSLDHIIADQDQNFNINLYKGE